MKTVFFALLTVFSMNAFATRDSLTSGWIVVQNINEESDFGVQQVAIVGCYGVAQGPQLTQFTAEHNVKSTMGCGDSDTSVMNINALSCAVVTESEENDDYASFKKIVLDISKCAYKENSKFITMIRTAAARNFPQTKNGKVVKGKEVDLVIVK